MATLECIAKVVATFTDGIVASLLGGELFAALGHAIAALLDVVAPADAPAPTATDSAAEAMVSAMVVVVDQRPRKIRLLALDVLVALGKTVNNGAALASFFPGIISALVRTLPYLASFFPGIISALVSPSSRASYQL